MLINNKSASKHNKTAYGYDPKLLKEYKNVLPWLNKITIKPRVNAFEKKRASSFLTVSVTAYITTENSVTASVPTDYPVTASVPSTNSVTESVTIENPVRAS